MTASPADELVEWVDLDGNVIDIVTRRRMRTENLRHRSVGIVVLSSDGRLLVHRRADTKDLRPGWWDVMAGGVVTAGEDVDVAAARELAEELGIDGVSLEPLGRARWDDVDSMEISQLYRVVCDGPFRFADGEVAEARLVTPSELAELRATVAFLPGSIAMLEAFLETWAETGGEPPVAERVRCLAVHRVEFTIEPFDDGRPGSHVTEAIAAVEALGHQVDVGPFGSSVHVPPEASGEIVATIVRVAFDNGASHVNIDIEAAEA